MLPVIANITLMTASILIAIHVGSLDLDRERALQLPVVQRTEWKG